MVKGIFLATGLKLEDKSNNEFSSNVTDYPSPLHPGLSAFFTLDLPVGFLARLKETWLGLQSKPLIDSI